MSKIEVDQVDPQSGTTLTLGTSGDTVSIPSGVTLANAGTVTGIPTSALTGTIALNQMATGTDGNIISYDASGNPVAVATGSAGQVLTSAGAGAPPTFAAAGGSMTPAFSVRLSGNQTIADSVTTKIQFNTEILDSDSAFNTTNYEFTVPSGKAGKYFIHLRNYIYGSGNAAMFSLNLDVKHTPSGGSQTNLIPMKYYEQSGSLEVGRSGSCSGIVDLGVGDIIAGYLSVSTNGLSPTCESSGTMFCGFKILE
jgi:hypothetical protein